MELGSIIPELILLGLCLVLVPLAGLTRIRFQLVPSLVALGGLVACLIVNLWMLGRPPQLVFHGTYAVDGFAGVFKILIELGAIITILLLMTYFRESRQLPHAPVAVVFSTLGAVGLSSSMDLGLIVLFLQMMSMAGYVLVALIRSDRRAWEGALKLFIYGAVALAVMAYGLSFVYGLTGSLGLHQISRGLEQADSTWLWIAFALVLVGYGFEAAIVPFHFWVPDVFDGASGPISGFLSVVPKLGGFAGLLRFLLFALPEQSIDWRVLLALLAAGTMFLGNLAALQQTALKRLLAYSTIAQAGYVLMALAVLKLTTSALPAASYYLAAYLFMNLGAFAVVGQMERSYGSDAIDLYRGLGRRAPWSSVILALSLLSLAGIPPLAGFFGKVLLLDSAIRGGYTWLAVVAVVNMVIGLYYYVNVVATVYFARPKDTRPIRAHPGFSVASAVCLAGTLALGIFPGPFLDWVRLTFSVISLSRW